MLHRAQVLGDLNEAQTAERRGRLREASSGWHRIRIGDPVVARARQAFPVEPIRSLDAIHLASALEAAAVLPGIELLSLDRRVRECGAELGFRLQPAEPGPPEAEPTAPKSS